MYACDYKAVESLQEAAALLQDDPEARLLAGGQTLIPALKQRLAAPSVLLDLGRLPELQGIALEEGVDGSCLRIGAMTCHRAVTESPLCRTKIPALAALAGMIGDSAIRNRGTLGGSVANNDPAADYPAALLALKAVVETDRREIPADDFFLDLFTTALEPGEILTAVRFGLPDQAGWAKFANPASRYAIVAVFVARFGEDVRLSVAGAGPCAFRIAEMEQALASSFSPAALESLFVPADDLAEDIHASPEWRAHLINQMASKAVARAMSGETGGA